MMKYGRLSPVQSLKRSSIDWHYTLLKTTKEQVGLLLAPPGVETETVGSTMCISRGLFVQMGNSIYMSSLTGSLLSVFVEDLTRLVIDPSPESDGNAPEKEQVSERGGIARPRCTFLRRWAVEVLFISTDRTIRPGVHSINDDSALCGVAGAE